MAVLRWCLGAMILVRFVAGELAIGQEVQAPAQAQPPQSLAKYEAARPPVVNGSIGQELKAAKVQAANVQAAGAAAESAALAPGRVEELGSVFSQMSGRDSGNELLVSVAPNGNYRAIFYANSWIGYIEPATGNILECEYMSPQKIWAYTIPALDCYVIGHYRDIPSFNTYPGTGTYIRSGDTLYYEDGRTLRDGWSGRWYWRYGTTIDGLPIDGQQPLYDPSYGSYAWYNGREAYRSGYYDWAYPNGGLLYHHSGRNLHFQGGGTFYSNFQSAPYYFFGNKIRESGAVPLELSYPGRLFSPYPISRNSGNTRTLSYFNTLSTTLKYESTPFNGRVYYENGLESFLGINMLYDDLGAYNSGMLTEILIQAQRTDDMISIAQFDGTTVHVVYSVRIKPPTPPTPIQVQITRVTSKKMDISWTSGGGSTRGFKLVYRTGGSPITTCSPALFDAPAAIDKGGSTSHTLTNLNPDTQYTVAVCAYNEIGEYSPNAVYDVDRTNPIVLPPPVTNLRATGNWYNAIDFAWNSGGGNTYSYRVAFASGEVPPPNCSTGTATSATVYQPRSLTADSPYSITVCAENEDGYSSGPVSTTSRTTVRRIPDIFFINPGAGSPGTAVTITGINLGAVTGLSFGAKAVPQGAGGYQIISDTEIIAIVPQGALSGKISVSAYDGNDSSDQVFIASPILGTMTPVTGRPGTIVTINGANLDSVTEVSFGGTPGTILSQTATQLKATVPAQAVTGVVSVTNPGGTATTTAVFKAAPFVASFDPPAGVPGTVVTVNGGNLDGVTTLKLGSRAVKFTKVSPLQITFVVPINGLSGAISATSRLGTVSSAQSFVVSPRITKISPSKGRPGMLVTVTGANLASVTSATFNGLPAAILPVSATSLKLTVPAGVTTGPVVLTNPGGSNDIVRLFKAAPSISNISSTAVQPGETITITGLNLSGLIRVSVGLLKTTFTPVSDTEVQVFIPLKARTGKIMLLGPGGLTKSDADIVLPPILRSMRPLAALAGATVTLTGTNLTHVSQVLFGATPATGFQIVSAAAIRAIAPLGLTGPVNVGVVNPAGAAITVQVFTPKP